LFFAHFCVSFQDLSYLVLRYVLAAFRAVQNKKAARVTLRTFYELQRRYKSNKRNKTVPRLAIYSKGNRKWLIGLWVRAECSGAGPWRGEHSWETIESLGTYGRWNRRRQSGDWRS
jgi:hypothetical protein